MLVPSGYYPPRIIDAAAGAAPEEANLSGNGRYRSQAET
jgi:hypothetical protein